MSGQALHVVLALQLCIVIRLTVMPAVTSLNSMQVQHVGRRRLQSCTRNAQAGGCGLLCALGEAALPQDVHTGSGRSGRHPPLPGKFLWRLGEGPLSQKALLVLPRSQAVLPII